MLIISTNNSSAAGGMVFINDETVIPSWPGLVSLASISVVCSSSIEKISFEGDGASSVTFYYHY